MNEGFEDDYWNIIATHANSAGENFPNDDESWENHLGISKIKEIMVQFGKSGMQVFDDLIDTRISQAESIIGDNNIMYGHIDQYDERI